MLPQSGLFRPHPRLNSEDDLMRLRAIVSLVFLLTTGIASAQQKHCKAADVDKSTGFCTAPDPRFTPAKWMNLRYAGPTKSVRER
jgi:hypothetical protein